VTPVQGTSGAMYDTSFMFSPAYPSQGVSAPAVLAAGTDQRGTPLVATCTATFVCRQPVVVGAAGTYAVPLSLYPSSDFIHDGTLFARSTSGLFKSTNGGTSFSPVIVGQPGAAYTTIPSFALSADVGTVGGGKRLYVAVYQELSRSQGGGTAGGIYTSTDGGSSWSAIDSPGLFDKGTSAIAAAPGGRLFAGYIDGPQHQGLLCSADGGANWAAMCPALSAENARQTGAGTESGAGRPASGCTTSCANNGTVAASGGQPSAAASPGGGDGSLAAGSAQSAARSGAPGHSEAMWLGLALAAGAIVAFVGRKRLRRMGGALRNGGVDAS
jgi:hypothetical protein